MGLEPVGIVDLVVLSRLFGSLIKSGFLLGRVWVGRSADGWRYQYQARNVLRMGQC